MPQLVFVQNLQTDLPIYSIVGKTDNITAARLVIKSHPTLDNSGAVKMSPITELEI